VKRGCDLLIFGVLISIMKIKIAACDSSHRGVARAVPGKLSNNEHGDKKGEPRGSPFLMARFQGRTE
jgi:hypothetical protein